MKGNLNMQRLKALALAFVAGFTLLGASLAPVVVVQAQSVSDVCAGVGQVTGNGDCAPAAGQKSVNDILKIILRILETIVGFIAVIMLIMGGLRYVLSQGDSAKLSSAKNTIIYALVGLVITAMSEIIVQFVLNRLK